MNTSISCGGVSIQPGDIIVGDADGVVVVPQCETDSVLKAAMLKLKKDQKRAESILGNPQAARLYIDRLFKNG